MSLETRHTMVTSLQLSEDISYYYLCGLIAAEAGGLYNVQLTDEKFLIASYKLILLIRQFIISYHIQSPWSAATRPTVNCFCPRVLRPCVTISPTRADPFFSFNNQTISDKTQENLRASCGITGCFQQAEVERDRVAKSGIPTSD